MWKKSEVTSRYNPNYLSVFCLWKTWTLKWRKKTIWQVHRVRDQVPLVWKWVKKGGKLNNKNKVNPCTEWTLQSPRMKINKVHDKKHKENDMSKLKPYFARIIRKLKISRMRKWETIAGVLITCKNNYSVAE